MSQNWFPDQGGQYGPQQPWGNHQQGWVQGGQWVGQTHPQTGYYGNQQQSFPMGYQQGQPQFQQFQAQPSQQLSLQQQQFNQHQQQLGHQQHFGQQQLGSQSQSVPQSGGGAGFKTQQAYAQEHERRMQEEKKKKELEQQKKKLQSLSVTKQKVNLDDLFVKQLPEVSKATRTTTTVPTTNAGSGGNGVNSKQGSATDETGPTSIAPGPEVTTAAEAPPPNTAEMYKKLMVESLDFSTSSKTKKGQFKPSSFKEPTTKDAVQHSQSIKARSWDAISDEFSGVFAQHVEREEMAQGVGGDTFGDFQSSNQPPPHGSEPVAFPAGAQALLSNTAQHTLTHQPIGNTLTGGLGHTLQTKSGSDPVSVPSDVPHAGSVMQSGSHMIATSAYQGPLTSTNVLHGMQGQAPNSPQRKNKFSAQNAAVLQMTGGLPSTAYRHTAVQFQAANPNNAPQKLGTSELVNSTPQMQNFGPPASGVDTSRFHPIYHKVFRLCRKPGDEFVSSELLHPVLLSSKLTRVQLRDLWSRANKGQPGKLSQMELFVLLGLVALAQAGNTNPTLEDLKRSSSMPVPTLPGLSSLSNPSSPQATSDDEFGDFHSSLAQPLGQPPLQATPTGPQPVLIPDTHTAPVNPVTPELPSQLQPVLPAALVDSASNSTSSRVQGLAGSPAALPPQRATPSPLPPETSSSDKYSVFRNTTLTGIAPRNDSTSPLPPSNPDDKYSAFEGLRPLTNSPQPLLTATGDLSQQLPPSHTSLFPSTQPQFPIHMGSLAPNSSTHVGPPSPNSSTHVGPPSPNSSTHVGPPAPHHRDPDPQQDDDFGNFAHFPTPPSQPAPGPPFPPAPTGHPTTMPVLTNLITPYPDTSPLPTNTATDTFCDMESFNSGKGLEKGSDEGWADFASAPSVQFPTTDSLTQNLMTSAQQQSMNIVNEVGPLGNGKPQSQKPTDSSKSRGFEFQHGGAMGDQGTVPTIDGMEKALLSKLTPTMPRKNKNAPNDEPSDSSGKKSPKNKVEKPARPVKPKMGSEEGWRVCLVKCGEVLGGCVEVVKDVEVNLLQEIVQSEESHNKLCGIAEVYRFAKRIYATLHSKHPTETVAEAEEVRKNWRELDTLLPDNTMEKLYSSKCPSSNPAPEAAPRDVLSDTISHCAICLMTKAVTITSSLSLDGRPEEYSLGLLFHNGQSYHAQCANFWSHLVSEDLPVLG